MSNQRSDYQRKYRAQYQRQTQRVNLTLSKSEYRAFVRAAKRHNGHSKIPLKPTTYIKQLALAALHQEASVPPEMVEELKTLRFAIHNIANNVNQIAHHANTIKQLTEHEEHSLLRHLQQLDELVKSYTEGRLLAATLQVDATPSEKSEGADHHHDH